MKRSLGCDGLSYKKKAKMVEGDRAMVAFNPFESNLDRVLLGTTCNHVNELAKKFALGFVSAPCCDKLQKSKRREINKRRYCIGSCSNGSTILQKQIVVNSEQFQARDDLETEKKGNFDDNTISGGNVSLDKDSLLLSNILGSANRTQ